MTTAEITPRNGYAQGKHAGHVTTTRALKPKQASRKGVSNKSDCVVTKEKNEKE